jgi:2-amino-4-hydroxy-6-hydroxymethyldihydropteridine diphosphokinase
MPQSLGMPASTVYLSLGSNLGDREGHLRQAIAALPPRGVRVTLVSSIYETQPVDYLEQPWFLNCAIAGETQVPPLDLLRALRGIESAMGSRKEFPKGPRLIDLDILLYGDQTIDTPELQVPHPRIRLRRFVLVPLVEIAPKLQHPCWNGTAEQLLGMTPDRSAVRRWP